MHLTVYCFMLAMVLLDSSVDAVALSRRYRRPVCEESQSCSYRFNSFDFELCDCPGNKQCPMDLAHGVELRGITYQFCSQRSPSVCESGELAAEVFTLQTSIYCVCPPHMSYIKRTANGEDVQYFCEEKPICEIDHVCGTIDASGVARSLCTCEEGWQCIVDEEVFVDTELQKGTCKPA